MERVCIPTFKEFPCHAPVKLSLAWNYQIESQYNYYNELLDNIQKVNFSEVKFQEVNIHLQVH